MLHRGVIDIKVVDAQKQQCLHGVLLGYHMFGPNLSQH